MRATALLTVRMRATTLLSAWLIIGSCDNMSSCTPVGSRPLESGPGNGKGKSSPYVTFNLFVI